MIKILLLTFSFWVLVFPSSVFAGSATLSLDPASGTFNQGCSFSINISLDAGGARSEGTDAIVFYDASRLTATSITNGTIYPDYFGNNIDTASGKITVSGLAAVNSPFAGKGVLASVNFTVKDNATTGSTQMTFDFNPADKTNTKDSNVIAVVDGAVVDELNAVVNGNYIIGTGGACGQATPTTVGSGKGGPINYATPSGGQAKTIDQIVDQTGKGPGTPQLTFTLAIFGSVLTLLGILGLAIL